MSPYCDIICRERKDREPLERDKVGKGNRFGIFRDGRIITIRDR